MLEGREIKAPYPGLRQFEAHESGIFFGREEHTDRLLEILQRERFLAVIGPSGAGKSSLVRAGLLPALSAGWLGGSSDWRIAELRPGERPFRRLSEALVSCGAVASDSPEESTLPTIEAELRRGPLGLVHLVAETYRSTLQGQGFKLFVLVDQFEEIFRYAQVGGPEADESEAFVNLLLASRSVADAGVYVALTMRTDFLGHCVRFLDLPDAINRAQYLTPRLTRAELEQAITGPALVFGGDVAPEVVNELINSLDQDFDQLPLLQHALARMWATEAEAKGDSPTLTIDSLRKLGGLQGALSAHAEEVFGQLSEVAQARAETLFRCITLREGTGTASRSTRRPQRLEQIAAVADCPWMDLEQVVTAFAADGVSFLHHGTPLGPESVIDISHEALIRQWDRLKDWAEDEANLGAEFLVWRGHATRWKAAGGELLRGADLARAVEWVEVRIGPSVETWASRYCDATTEGSFYDVQELVSQSREAEDRRAIEDAVREQRREHLERQALETRTELERARAVSAERERDQARKQARLSRRLTWLAAATALVTLILALVAWRASFRANRISRESLARQLANEAIWGLEQEPERAQLLAVESLQTANLPVSEFAVRKAFLHSENLMKTLRGHSNGVLQAVFSPDGRSILTAGGDETAKLWDSRTGLPLVDLRGHLSWISDATFSTDGLLIVTASADGTARVWNTKSGQVLQSLQGHASVVRSANFSVDGKVILTSGTDFTARVWDALSGKLLRTLLGHTGWISSSALSQDGRFVVTASLDGTARLWETATGSTLREFREGDQLWHARFSPNEQTILTSNGDGAARLWATDTGQLLRLLSGHRNWVFDAEFSPNGRTVATASFDNTAILWEASSGEMLHILVGHEDTVRSAVFSPNGTTVLTASDDKTARIWDLTTGQLLQNLRGHQGAIVRATFSPDGHFIATASRDDTARLWSAAVTSHPVSLKHDERVASTTFSADGHTLLTASVDGTARLWNTASGQLLRTLHFGEPTVRCLFSHDARRLLTTSDKRIVRLWEANTGRLLNTLDHDRKIEVALFSANSNRVLTTSSGGKVRVWDSETGQLIKVFVGTGNAQSTLSPDGSTALIGAEHSPELWDVEANERRQALAKDASYFESAVYEPLGRYFALASGETVSLWDAASGELLRELHPGSTTGMAFSPDGGILLTKGHDRTVRLWNLKTGTLAHALRGHEGPVEVAVISPDSRTVLTGSQDTTAKLWDVGSGQLLQTLSGHKGWIRAAKFSPDGKRIVTIGDDRVAMLWECSVCLPATELASRIRLRIGRELTPEERAQSGISPVP